MKLQFNEKPPNRYFLTKRYLKEHFDPESCFRLFLQVFSLKRNNFLTKLYLKEHLDSETCHRFLLGTKLQFNEKSYNPTFQQI